MNAISPAAAAVRHPTIRPALEADLPDVYHLLVMGHSETKPLSLSQPKLVTALADVFERGLILVTEQAGQVVGTAALVGDCPWYSDEIVLNGMWLFVHPQHRRSPHARMLLEAMRACATEARLPLYVEFMARPGEQARVAGKRRLFERVFGEPTGMSFYIPAKG